MTTGQRADDTRMLLLDGGRSLAWSELGEPDGTPVLVFHGTPGSRLQLATADAPARRAGVRLVVPDRPGYGLSGYERGRRLTGWADEVARLADHLGLDRFAVAGVSGGGPHAAVCGALLPDRVTAVAIISGVAPLDQAGSEAGMTGTDVALLRLARVHPLLTRPFFEAMAVLSRRWPERALGMLADQLGPVDAQLLARTDVRDSMLADLRATSWSAGAAMAQDYGLFAHDWGFRLEDLSVPVLVWHGTEDRDVPLAQARRLASAIPGAVLHERADYGHLLVVAVIEEVLGVLASL